jgi:ubiquinone/menaquinone biosynthesis C-methylase UbiE
MRTGSYGENHRLTLVDRFGVYLSSRNIVSIVRKNRPERTIDIGCGYNAVILQQIKRFSQNLTGIDIKINSELTGINKIERTIESDLSFLGDSTADLVILNSVLEHLSEPDKILKEIYRVIDTDGMLILNVPNWLGKYFLETSAFKLHLSPAEEMNDHKMYYNKKDIWPLLVKAGFQPINIRMKYHKLFLNTICYAKK